MSGRINLTSSPSPSPKPPAVQLGPTSEPQGEIDEHGVCGAYVLPREGHGRWGCEACGFSADMHDAAPQSEPQGPPKVGPCPNCGATIRLEPNTDGHYCGSQPRRVFAQGDEIMGAL